MSPLIWIMLLTLLVCQTILVVVVLLMFKAARDHLSTAMSISHAGCVEQIARLVSTKHDAALLRVLADEYDAVENHAVLERMRRESRTLVFGEGVTIPALWLRMQADRLDPPPPMNMNEVAEFNLAGDRLT